MTIAELSRQVRSARRERTDTDALADVVSLLFAGWYATERLLLGFFRTDPVRAIGLTGTLLASLAVVVAVVVRIVRRVRPGSAEPTSTERAVGAAA